VLVRCATVTHTFNPDQRHITLEFRRDKGDLLVARVPDNPAVAIVGYYLLFVIDGSGRPSPGRFIQICAGRSRSGAGDDADWWQRLRDRFTRGLDLDESEIRQFRRQMLGPVAPPRRRLVLEGRHGHGHGDQDHDHEGHPH
ncbi:MAG: galactose oxidase early set domain-containing protein, partial [Geodermatophilaceae bacterium]